MFIKIKSKFKQNRLFIIIIAIVGLFTVGASLIVITALGGSSTTLSVPSEVVLNGITYTNKDPFEILEIVPQEGLGELGYMVGGNSMPILASDIDKIPDAAKRTEVRDAWKDCVGCITNIWDRTKYSDDGLSIEGFADRNLFAYSIFGNSNMTDKVHVKTVGATSVTKEMVDEADMVYINPGYHSIKYYEAYNLMSQYCASISGLSKSYQNANTDSSKAKFSQYNLSAQATLEIYIKSIKNNMPVVFDNSQVVWDNISQNDNYSKLGQLLLDIDPISFVTDYASQYSNGIYSGTKGSFGIYNSTLQVVRNSTNVNWNCEMFMENHNSQYPYFNGGNRNLVYLRKNMMSYSGYNLMDMIFLKGSSNMTDYNGNGAYLGTDFDVARNEYGTNAEGNLAYTSMVRYIIGESPREESFHQIHVLEVEPCGDYEFNNYDGAVKIVKMFGYATNILNEQNWTDYVDVRSIASNGFIGMNEDLKEKYDLIIVGTRNYGGKMLSPYPFTYSSKGTQVKIVNINKSTRYSGNDLTGKALSQVIDYAKAGKPLVLSKTLYYGTSVDSSSNMYNLSMVKLEQELNAVKISDKNIISIPDDNSSYPYLTRMEKPEIKISDDFKMMYQDDVAITMISKKSLSNFNFYGKIGTGAKTYHLNVSFDKNGNGLFEPESSGDSNEVFYNGNVTTNSDGSFSIPIQLPEGLRGYMAWKAIATDNENALTSEDTGGFVIEVQSEDIKTVNLLQILPTSTASKPITLNMKTNQRFQALFSQVENVTGLKLNVTTITTRDYEAMFQKDPYKGYEINNLLKNYSMVVIGFADSFGLDDISNANGALDNLYDFINKGNSVLFVHDTMSYSAYSDGTRDQNGNATYNYGNTINSSGTGGFQLTSKFRNRIGMDRYGASVGDSSGSDYVQGYSNQFLIKYGRSSTNSSYSIFSNISPNTSDVTTNEVEQLNRGQITEFPYSIPKKLNISPTHAQWYQLNLEGQSNQVDDVVVWYTLASSDPSDYSKSVYYDYTGQDALNGYYIYSKGNVTYTGAGHSQVDQDSELKLFVNTVIRAILSGNSAPVVKVNNAAMVTVGDYDLFSRDSSKIPSIDFTALDSDMSRNTGKFQSGILYWDVDGDHNYNNGDIILVQYDSNQILWNGRNEVVDLQKYAQMNAGGTSFLTSYQNNSLRIGIQATDGCNATGSASVAIRYRNLFNLN